MADIILLTIDSLRAVHLGCYGYRRNISPNMDKLASRGAMFSEAISNGGRTPDAFTAMLASVPSLTGKPGVVSHSVKTLAQQLKEGGYRTAAFHSNPYLTRYYGYSRGFDVFDDSLDEYSFWKGRLWMRAATKPHRNKKGNKLVGYLFKLVAKVMAPFSFHVVRRPIVTAEDITSRGLSWLEEKNEKSFLWLHYMDVHHPYLPQQQYLSRFREQPVSRRQMAELYRKMLKDPQKLSPDDVTTLVDLYDADIRHVDDSIGWLIESLGERSKDAVIIIVADHGDEFGEHGNFSHQSLYDGIIRVPLIMAGPGIKGGSLVEQQVSLLDLPPTISSLAGVGSPQFFNGESLLPAINGEKIETTGVISVYNRPDIKHRLVSFRTPQWKYIRTEKTGGSAAVLAEEIYDLRSDPGEKQNLHAGGNREAEAFAKQAEDAIAGHSEKQGRIEDEKDRIRARLKRISKK